MKKIILGISLLISTAVAVQAQFNADKDAYLTQPLSSEKISNVLVETSGGSITVASVSAGQERIEMFVRPNNWNGGLLNLSKDELKQRLEENYTVSIKAEGGKLMAIAKQKKDINWKKSVSISFKVYVAQNVSTDLHTSGGSITLQSIKGKQDFSTSGGSLHIDDVSGNIHGNTSGGSIHVSNSSDNIEISTSGGSVEAKNCKGDISLETSGGSLKLFDLSGNISANTSGGSITAGNIKGELKTSTSGGSVKLDGIAGSVKASTSGGSMNVNITELGSYVQLDNSGGNISVDLPAGKGLNLDVRGNKINYNNLNNFSGDTADDDYIKGKINGGGPEIKIRASSGKVQLNFK
ncbi:MAG TPA: hypothetical protein PL045_02190 [Chitinophagaceae bacterium]|nr:hypothetical protein [Chitinophagaceae bacterium]